MNWGDKGCEYRPDKCNHESDDGCEWCCMTCNLDRHFCPGCGTVSNHKSNPCDNYCVMITVYRAKGVELIRPKDVKVWPMWDRCDKCNYDMHTCPGCGTPVRHYSSGVCSECEKL